jgi:hypothetical protein
MMWSKQMVLKIEREPWNRLGVGHTKFEEDYVLKNENDPLVPGTRIKRLRPVSLGERARGFFSDETDALLVAMRALRDATPFTPPKPAVPAEFHPARHRNEKRRADKRATKPAEVA